MVMVDAPAGTAVTKKITWSNILSTLASAVQTLTNKTLTSPKINEDVAVTASATEINLLDGATAVIGSVVEDTTPQLGGALDGQGNDLNNMGVLFLTEQAAAETNVAGKGQFYVQNATPNIPIFADDTGAYFSMILGTKTQTLTNKTLNGDSNTLSNLDLGNEVDWAAAADVSDRGAFASGDKLLIFEDGTGLRKIDYDDLPGAGGGLANVVEDTTPQLGGALDAQGYDINNGGVIFLTEQADAEADVAGKGQLWVNTATPNELYFTDDAGTDAQVVLPANTVTLTNKTIDGDNNTISNLVIGAEVTGASTALTDTGDLTYNADTDVSANGWVVDEDTLTSNLDTKVPTQQSVKAYIDTFVGSSNIATVGTVTSGDVTAVVSAASTTLAGKAELATTAETTTGTDTGRVVTPDGLAGSIYGRKTVVIKVLAEDTALATGNGKAYFTVPVDLNGMNLVDADIAVYTVSSSGTPTVQIHNLTDTTDMLSTAITVDTSEFNSYTAATPPVINTAADDVVTGDRLRIDVDVAGTGTTGLDVILVFETP